MTKAETREGKAVKHGHLTQKHSGTFLTHAKKIITLQNEDAGKLCKSTIITKINQGSRAGDVHDWGDAACAVLWIRSDGYAHA